MIGGTKAERARAVIASQLRKHIDDASDEASLAALGADSLDLQLLAVTLEDTFAVTITDEQLATSDTVGQLLGVVVPQIGQEELL